MVSAACTSRKEHLRFGRPSSGFVGTRMVKVWIPARARLMREQDTGSTIRWDKQRGCYIG
ncbi:hypothetical protein BC938DRAFT_473548 [Jimgerdemannia flammicorona]|uniref:Uncharacterized protein n=1 Tax=Jimgerdemannia flammicorona TaxID=994334 RepID=A0A433Q3Y7_9FUNG|nr:hypothetical protein BC938DRAFT_473548 [Jimgerdemannia flammicorona]